MKIRNKKAQLEIVALALLVAGVTTIASAGLLSVGGSAEARAGFTRDFLFMENTLEGMELFYSDMMRIATEEALENKGHDMENFCAPGVKVDEDLKNSILDRGNELAEEFETYKGQKLPLMKTDGGEVGILDLKVVEESTRTEGYQKSYSYENEVVYEYPTDYYVTEINAKVTLGGAGFLQADVVVKAYDSAGKETCGYKFVGLDPHVAEIKTFPCNGLVKKIKAWDEGWIHYVDVFEAQIKTPALGYIEVSGKPAEKIKVEKGKLAISSGGAFSFPLRTTADAKPDLLASSVELTDPDVKAGETVMVKVEFQNIGCAKVNKDSKIIIRAGDSELLNVNAGKFSYGETKTFSASWTPDGAGTYAITATIDKPDNRIAELNENNNEKSLSVEISEAESSD